MILYHIIRYLRKSYSHYYVHHDDLIEYLNSNPIIENEILSIKVEELN